MDELAGLVEQVAIFYRRHVDGHGAGACVDLLSWLDSALPGIPKVPLPFIGETGLDPASLALGIVRDVGELAGMLIQSNDSERAMTWARANLVVDVERYRDAIAIG